VEMVGRDSWIDVSVPLRTGMVHYPGDPEVVITRDQDISRGDPVTLTRMSLGAHAGTHIDAPLHFLAGGRSIDQVALDAVNGPARIIPIADRVSVEIPELETHDIKAGEILLFKTRNSVLWKDDVFHEDFVYLSTEAASYLAGKRVRAVGIDYLSIGGYGKNETEVHTILLAASIWIVESLDLSHVEPGAHQLLCLPLRIEGAEAAPARAFLRRIG